MKDCFLRDLCFALTLVCDGGLFLLHTISFPYEQELLTALNW